VVYVVKALVLWLCMLSGCLSRAWDDVPGAVVTPVADRAEHQAEWEVNVAFSVNEWGDGLEGVGCPRPFVVGDGGHPVTLIYTEGNTHGVQDVDGIEVYQQRPSFPLLVLHELGHALGLDHAPDGEESVMTAWVVASTVSSYDIKQAACVLGCGPCS